MRRNPSYICGIVPFTRIGVIIDRFAREAADQFGQRNQISKPQECISTADDDVRVFTRKICPLRGNWPNSAVVRLQQKTLAMPVAPPPDT